MDIFANTTPNFSEIFQRFWDFFIHGGWIGFVIVIIYVLYLMYYFEIRGQFVRSQQWIFLNIRIPRQNVVSTLAVEQIYAQLHAMHGGLTFAQMYIEGVQQLWFSLEIISLGGNVSFVVRCPKKTRDLVEAAFYAQYPGSEIVEISDYLENIEYDPDTSEFDLFGYEWKMDDDQSIPIRTYKDFEHEAAEQKIIDPLGPLIEGMIKMEPHEFFGVQIIIQPLADNEWKPKGELKAKELMGEKPPEKFSIFRLLLLPFELFAKLDYLAPLKPAAKVEEEKDKGNFMRLPDAEKARINAIHEKISKPGYLTKIRHLYIAPKDRFDNSKKALIIGAYRTLSNSMLNKLKPDTQRTWTGLQYKFSPGLEKSYIDYTVRLRKKRFFHAYKDRNIVIGLPQFILNIEEIATLFHLPLLTPEATPSIETIGSRKSQPPTNLPIGDFPI